MKNLRGGSLGRGDQQVVAIFPQQAYTLASLRLDFLRAKSRVFFATRLKNRQEPKSLTSAVLVRFWATAMPVVR